MKSKLPDRWHIKITKKNLESVGDFYAREGASVYTNKMMIGKYLTSHNHTSDISVLSTKFDANFSTSCPEKYGGIEITTEEFYKFVLNKRKSNYEIYY